MKKLLLLPLMLLIGIAANAQCAASFTSAAAPSGNNLLRRSFTNTSTYGTGGTYGYNTGNINYGDGTNSYVGSSGTFIHDYPAPGTYTVGLRIKRVDSLTNTVICTDSTTQTITVAYTPCGTSFSSVTGSGGVVTFTVNTPAGTSGMTYSINYGDGTSGSSLTHTYAGNGYYTATLTATGGGCTYTNTISLYVGTSAVSCANLHATFSSSVSNNVAYFSNTSTNASGLTRVSTWNYGDGNSGTTNSHTYAATGTYTVKLKVQWLDSATQALHCQDSITHNVTITTIPNAIVGNIISDSLGLTTYDTFKIWLIQQPGGTNLLVAVDSMTATGWGSANYIFSGKPAGNYLVKAARLNQVVGSMGIIPTYHDSSLYWNMAQTISHPGTGYTYAHIWMRHGTVTSGPGFVGGNVTLGANKGAGAGVAGLTVILLDANNKAVASTYTDGSGNFSFANIPLGTYSVYPEHMNYATTAKTNVTITSAVPTDINSLFHQDDNQMNIKPVNLGIGNPKGLENVFRLYPNPTSKTVNVSWNDANVADAHIIITNTAGQVVVDEAIGNNAKGFKSINISTLTPGVYFLRGTAALTGTVQKLIVE